MNRKDYKLIAEVIAYEMGELQEAKERATTQEDVERTDALQQGITKVAYALAQRLGEKDPGFNHAVFIDACNVKGD